MKRLNLRYIFLAIIPVAFTACDDENLIVLNPNADITAAASKTAVVLSKEEEGTDAITISWPQPDYGFSASPSYFVYLDKEDGNFEAPVAVNVGGNLSKTFKVDELNKHLLNLGFQPGVSAKLQMKVESKLGLTKSVWSDVVSVDATAYEAFLDLTTSWGIVGSGYNNWGAFPDAPFFTTSTPNVLVAYVKLLTGEIKFRENNSWDNNLGDDGGDGTLESNGANIAVTAGLYRVTFNTLLKTYAIEPFTWGIVGSAYNDWGGAGPDFPFTYDDATDQWRALVKLQTGAFKIRKNNDWGVNLGDNGGDGTLESGGSDINITAGKYQITFSEKDMTIEIVSIPSLWGLVGSAYNDWGATPDAAFDRDWRNDGVWVLNSVYLQAGAFKIRDANDWGTNYGDDGNDGTLELNGSDIPVASAGYYKVVIDFSNPSSPTITTTKY
jgi:starch-binding outer membrane protein SusE/F